MPTFSPYPQGSTGWLKERIGFLTASKMADAMSFMKSGKESEARKKLKIAIVAERMCDMSAETYVTPAMEWGITQEPYARQRYEEITGNLVVQCGFVIHDTIQYWGCSPDGLVDDDGLIEIKCPTSETFVEWVSGGVVPDRHKPQMLAQLAVTGRKWVDFFAFDPRVKVDSCQYFLRRFEPPEEAIAVVEEAARKFLAEVDELFERITSQEVGR